MPFKNLFSVLALIKPDDVGFFFNGHWIGAIWSKFLIIICNLIYGVCKWFLAIVDFLQYFIQKLIGLNYWLDGGQKTLKGATESDLLFSFLYDEVVQKVFRTLVGLFIVLLLVFTIFAIIKEEWKFATDSAGDLNKGTNTKTKIIANSIKAVALVLITPIVLTIGIISSNAILASIVKALSVDMSESFGNKIFSVASVNANKYRIYEQQKTRVAVSDTVTFYIDEDERQVLLGKNGGSDDFSITYCDFTDYKNAINAVNVKKYSVNSMFPLVNPKDYESFYGYCIRMDFDDNTSKYYLVSVDVSGSSSSEDIEKINAMYYYLKNILRVQIMTQDDNIGNAKIQKELKSKINNKTFPGFISNFNLDGCNNADVNQAAFNTWSYGTIFETTTEFVNATESLVLNNNNLTNVRLPQVTNAKIMYNAYGYEKYFDGGQLGGVVQLDAEYGVMADVIDFICDTGANLFMVDITSPLIDWKNDKCNFDTKFVSTIDDETGDPDTFNFDNTADKYMSFIVDYGDSAPDNEQGKTLYLAKCGEGNELKGSKYIMCWKTANQGNGFSYIPVVNRKNFVDDTTGRSYTFKSKYYADSYHGLVLAKGAFDSNDNSIAGYAQGDPTYLKTGSKMNDDNLVFENVPYYYNLSKQNEFSQTITKTSNFSTFKLTNVSFDSEENSNYTIKFEGTNKALFSIINDNGDKQSISDSLLSNINLHLVDNSASAGISKNRLFSYIGEKNGNLYLFADELGNLVFVKYDENKNLSIYGIDGAQKIVSQPSELTTLGGVGDIDVAKLNYEIDLKYSRTSGGFYDSLVYENINPTVLNYSKQLNGKSLFSTNEKFFVNIVDGSNDLIKTNMILNFYMNTDKTIYSVSEDGIVDIADGLEAYTLTMYNIDVYDFMTGAYGSGAIGDVGRYENGLINTVSPINTYQFGISEAEFEVNKNSKSFEVYNGNAFVAKFAKAKGVEVDKDNLVTAPVSVIVQNQTYYNIQSQNRYEDTSAMSDRYKTIYNSYYVGCYRDEMESVSKLCINFSVIEGFKNTKLTFAAREMTRDQIADSVHVKPVFSMAEGIQFDYFFEGSNNSLVLFYSATKFFLSYWLILLCAALIIKTLGTALWGVIKRFYEITLYYLALPVAASTYPLDNGKKFNDVQASLIKNVLGTYGVILGLNVFFILLTPVESISQIFTDAELQSSTSYFLKHFWFGADVLNKYVYILFVLVAFTLIDTLSNTISSLVGGTDLVSEGKTTKENVGKAINNATDVVSGKSAMDFAKKSVETVSKTPLSVPIKWAVGGVKKAIGGIGNAWNSGTQNNANAANNSSGGTSSSSRASTDSSTASGVGPDSSTTSGVGSDGSTTSSDGSDGSTTNGTTQEGQTEAENANAAQQYNREAGEQKFHNMSDNARAEAQSEAAKEFAEKGENAETTNNIANSIIDNKMKEQSEASQKQEQGENKGQNAQESKKVDIAELISIEQLRALLQQILGKDLSNVSDKDLKDNYQVQIGKELGQNVATVVTKDENGNETAETIDEAGFGAIANAVVQNASSKDIANAMGNLSEEDQEAINNRAYENTANKIDEEDEGVNFDVEKYTQEKSEKPVSTNESEQGESKGQNAQESKKVDISELISIEQLRALLQEILSKDFSNISDKDLKDKYQVKMGESDATVVTKDENGKETTETVDEAGFDAIKNAVAQSESPKESSSSNNEQAEGNKTDTSKSSDEDIEPVEYYRYDKLNEATKQFVEEHKNDDDVKNHLILNNLRGDSSKFSKFLTESGLTKEEMKTQEGREKALAFIQNQRESGEENSIIKQTESEIANASNDEIATAVAETQKENLAQQKRDAEKDRRTKAINRLNEEEKDEVALDFMTRNKNNSEVAEVVSNQIISNAIDNSLSEIVNLTSVSEIDESQKRTLLQNIVADEATDFSKMSKEDLDKYSINLTKDQNGNIVTSVKNGNENVAVNQSQNNSEIAKIVSQNATDEQIEKSYKNINESQKADLLDAAMQDKKNFGLVKLGNETDINKLSNNALRLVEYYKDNSDVTNEVILRQLEQEGNLEKYKQMYHLEGFDEKTKDGRAKILSSIGAQMATGNDNMITETYKNITKDGRLSQIQADVVLEKYRKGELKKVTAYNLASDAEKQEFVNRNTDLSESEKEIKREMAVSALNASDNYSERIIQSYMSLGEDQVGNKESIDNKVVMIAAGLDKKTNLKEYNKATQDIETILDDSEIARLHASGKSNDDIIAAYAKLKLLKLSNSKQNLLSVLNDPTKTYSSQQLTKSIALSANSDKVAQMLMKGDDKNTPLLTTDIQSFVVDNAIKEDKNGIGILEERAGGGQKSKSEIKKQVRREANIRQQVDELYAVEGAQITADQLNSMKGTNEYNELLQNINRVNGTKETEISDESLKNYINSEENVGEISPELEAAKKQYIRHEIENSEAQTKSQNSNKSNVFNKVTDEKSLIGEEKGNFEYRKAIIESQIQSEGNSSSTLYNIFENSNFVGKNELQRQIDEKLAQAGIDKNDKDYEGKIREIVNELLGEKKNEGVKNTLINIASTDVKVAFNESQKLDREKDIINSDSVLTKQIKDRFGADKDISSLTNKEIETISNEDKSFAGRLDMLLQQKIDPSKNTSVEQREEFFKNMEAANVRSKPVAKSQSVQEAADDFFAGKLDSRFVRRFNKGKKNLPENSENYDNWNARIDRKIDEIKAARGIYATISKEERIAKIQELKAQKIDINLPTDFANMSAEAQLAYQTKQDENKLSAIVAAKFMNSQDKTNQKQYNSWNNAISVEIENARNGSGKYKGKSEDERNKAIENLEAKKINLKAASGDEQNEENKRQARESIMVKDGISKRKVRRVNNRNAINDIVGGNNNSTTFVGLGHSDEERKEKHKENLAQVDNAIDRFNATKSMRVKERDFGTNFDEFAKSYGLSEKDIKAINASANKQNIKENTDKMYAFREHEIAKLLNKKHIVASAKVAKDNNVNQQSFLTSYGINTDDGVVRYKNGIEHVKANQSRINIPLVRGLDNWHNARVAYRNTRKFAGKDSESHEQFYHTTDGINGETGRKIDTVVNREEMRIALENEKAQIEKANDIVSKFARNYKGKKEDYMSELEKTLGPELFKKMKLDPNKTMMFGETISDKSIAIQQKEVERQLANLAKKNAQRIKWATPYIPSTNPEMSGMVGKTFTTTKTERQMFAEKRNAENIRETYASVSKGIADGSINNQNIDKIKNNISEDIKTQIKNFDKIDNVDKLKELLEAELLKANRRVIKNEIISPPKVSVDQLGGILQHRDKSVDTRLSSSVRATLSSNDMTIYRHLVESLNSANGKLTLEQSNLEKLLKALDEQKKLPQTKDTKNNIADLEKAILNSKININNLQELVNSARQRKDSFEKAVAGANTKEAQKENQNTQYVKGGSNKSVVEQYRFPYKKPDGTSGIVRPGTPEAKNIEKCVEEFISKYKSQLDTMLHSQFDTRTKELYDYINNVSRKLNNDFARNYRSLMLMQQKLRENIDNLKNKNDKESKKLKADLELNATRLDKTMDNLRWQFAKMGIEIKKQ